MFELIARDAYAVLLSFLIVFTSPIIVAVPAWRLRRRISPVWVCGLAGLAAGALAIWISSRVCPRCGTPMSMTIWGFVIHAPAAWVEPALKILSGGIWGTIVGMGLVFFGAEPHEESASVR